ncbi:MAG: cytochrome c [Acidimicrobiia bacterium]|nr:cytochrome c [Acidimicrobiia bacterium]
MRRFGNVRDSGGTSGTMRRLLGNIAAVTLLVGAFGVAHAGAQGATDDPAQVEAGMAVFESNCAGCHGADGTGTNSGRPLTDVATQEPDRLVHIASVTDGKGNMPAFGGNLEADEIDAAVSYVRLTFVSAQEPELAVTGRTTSTLLLVSLTALVGGLGMAAASRRMGRETL